MSKLRARLTYANVMSTLFVFLALGGATAFAATQLEKNSVGARQLQSNAVTAAKIKKNAVTRAKIKANSINSSKVAKNSLTGADINAGKTPFSHAVARLQSNVQQSFAGPTFYPLGTYTQAAGEDDQFIASATVNFAASCEPERGAFAYLVMDPPASVSELDFSHVLGLGVIEDNSAGAETRTMSFIPYVIYGSMSRLAPASGTQHTLSLLLGESDCETGSGVTISGAQVDVIGTKQS